MSFIDDLTKATNLFQRNATGYATQKAIGDAALQMEELRTQYGNEAQKSLEFRKQQRNLANDLSLQLTQLGADQGDIQSAFRSIAPQQFSTSAQALQAGEEEVAARMEQMSRAKTKFNTDEAIRLAQARISSTEKKEAEQGILIPDMKPIKGVQITKDSVKKVKSAKAATDSLVPTLKQLTSMFEKYGTEFGGENAAQMEQLVRDAQLIYKNEDFAGLGVLTGPDLKLLEEILPDLTSAGANVASTLSLGYTNKAKLAKLKQITSKAQQRFQALSKAHGFEVSDMTNGGMKKMSVKPIKGANIPGLSIRGK